VFDTELSPGTVYPRLHDLDDQGLLRARELVQTTEYLVDGDEAAGERVESAMRQHLALGCLLSVALDEE
jgi:DNA-binding PadR family transcriptional regulator